jgi:hypothetical protein
VQCAGAVQIELVEVQDSSSEVALQIGFEEGVRIEPGLER